MTMREFTLAELAKFDGREGRPAYIVFEGVVYDVTASPLWKNGMHVRKHPAGQDLSDQLAVAPHWGEVFTSKNVVVVGTLRADQIDRRLPEWLGRLCRRVPMVRRHPHPIAAHFPTAYCLAAALFLALHLWWPWRFADFEAMSAAMLVLGFLGSLAAVATGVMTLWINYQLRAPVRVKFKMGLSTILLASQIGCLVMRAGGQPDVASPQGRAYAGLVFVSAGLVVALGALGGQMVFPTNVD